jgi:NADPH:quinone reductase-like Zn-dependent oxidoreductase
MVELCRRLGADHVIDYSSEDFVGFADAAVSEARLNPAVIHTTTRPRPRSPPPASANP